MGPVGHSDLCYFPKLCVISFIVNFLKIKSLYALSFLCNFYNNP